MRHRFVTTVPVLPALVLALVATSFAATPEEAGRAVLERYAPAVVTLRVSVKTRMTMDGSERSQESKTETIGTVLEDSGLTAVSLSSIDPSQSIKQMADQSARRNGKKVDVKVDSEVSDATLVLGDGSELAARVVLRDKDLDLALVQPTTRPARPLVHVDLAGDASPKVLEQIISLYRLGKMAGRTATASIDRLSAVVGGPRPYSVPGGGEGVSGIGSPVFNFDGVFLGLTLIRSVPPEDDSNLGTMFNGAAGLGLLPIVVPTAQLRDSVAQAHEASAE